MCILIITLLLQVVHWIKSKGQEEAGSVDIGESLAAALLLEEKLNKLTNKVEVSTAQWNLYIYLFINLLILSEYEGGCDRVKETS